MHIVIDLQGAQASNRYRGIGRASLSLALAMASLAYKKHRISLVLNADFADSYDFIREKFQNFIRPEDFYAWKPLTPCFGHDQKNLWRLRTSRVLYSAFIKKLNPDAWVTTSIFEGFVDNAVSSVPSGEKGPVTGVMLYDLIPYIYPDLYLPTKSICDWYYGCLAQLRQSDLMLAISASSRQEAIDYLDVDENKVINISISIDSRFKILDITKAEENLVKLKYGLVRPFIMYTGGIDTRKNIEGLIAAYASLPLNLRKDHQLAIVCSADQQTTKNLFKLATSLGLEETDLVLTGFVSDEDLLVLYNICKLFVFPSWHEGFGLPVLEAMACGAVVIAGNNSSLPEVIGFQDALFDARRKHAIAQAIKRGLLDERFRADFKSHAKQQVAKFSWQKSAELTIKSLEDLYERKKKLKTTSTFSVGQDRTKPRLAYVSPIQPALTGIADYSSELLPVLAEYYEIDVLVHQPEAVSDPWVLANTNRRSLAWFENHADSYDRILYHIGNNADYHAYMFDLLERHAGVVVLHDFFLNGPVSWFEGTGKNPLAWQEALWLSHGWTAVKHRFEAEDEADVHDQWPCNLAILERALGVIVHSETSRKLANKFYGKDYAHDWAVIPHLRTPAVRIDRAKARQKLGLNETDILVCSFGFLGKSKLNHKLLEAWLSSTFAQDKRCRLVFVGDGGGDYAEEIYRRASEQNSLVEITGYADEKKYHLYLAATDIAVQLRTSSRGETSGTVLDCMNYGIATIVNSHGSMSLLPRDAVYMLDDKFSTEDLAKALEILKGDRSVRALLGDHARDYIHHYCRPANCARLYNENIEKFYDSISHKPAGIVKKVVPFGLPSDLTDIAALAERSTELLSKKGSPDSIQILLDISELHQRDAKSGIQRVVRNVLRALLTNPPKGVRVEPVYATEDQGYRYARRFTAQFLELKDVGLQDEKIFSRAGDIFWGLDLQPNIIPRRKEELFFMNARGVKIVFTVYDLLTISLPETFSSGAAQTHANWLRTLASVSNGLISISKTVSDELKQWLSLFAGQYHRPIKLGWTHLGADIDETVSIKQDSHFTIEEVKHLDRIAKIPSFLMVGTIEPRKMQQQAMAAFDLLWNENVDVALVIVGKPGWMTEELQAHMRSHPQRNRRFFLFEGCRDSLLEKIYQTSSCLIAASLDEGYGLPLIEAARHKMPIIARDIPVFREVAGEYASYFSGLSPRDLANAVEQWLENNQEGKAPRSAGISFMNWDEATHKMLEIVMNDRWQDIWVPVKESGLLARYYGSDPQLLSQIGQRVGSTIWTKGEKGHLFYGPYSPMHPGAYKIIIKGHVGRVGLNGAWLDVVMSGGETILAMTDLIAEPDPGEQVLADIDLTITEPCSDFEIRVNVDCFSDFGISLVEIHHLKEMMNFNAKQVIESDKNPKLVSYDRQKIVMGFWATHRELLSTVGYKSERRIYTTGRSGFLIYGPYRNIAAGYYVLKVYGILKKSDTAWIDISYNKGVSVVARTSLSEPDSLTDGVIANLNFKLDHFVENIEIRIYVSSKTDMTFDCFTIEEASDAPMVS